VRGTSTDVAEVDEMSGGASTDVAEVDEMSGGASTDVAEVDGSCGKLDEGHESFEAREPSSECDERPKRHPPRLVHRGSGLTGEQQREGIPM